MVPSFIPAETYVPRLTSGYQIPGPSARTSDSFSIQTGFSMNRGSPGSILRERMVPGEPRFIENPVWIEKLSDVLADGPGIWYPLVKRSEERRVGKVCRSLLAGVAVVKRRIVSGVC